MNEFNYLTKNSIKGIESKLEDNKTKAYFYFEEENMEMNTKEKICMYLTMSAGAILYLAYPLYCLFRK